MEASFRFTNCRGIVEGGTNLRKRKRQFFETVHPKDPLKNRRKEGGWTQDGNIKACSIGPLNNHGGVIRLRKDAQGKGGR